jgi:enamine deaminase RidA (YjgF/YER057c/UK114 family)
MSTIVRHELKGVLSKAVEHAETVYLAGITAADKSKGIKQQTAEILTTIDRLLSISGTSKSKILTAMIWLSDIRNRAAMNEAWAEWVDPDNLPARACVEARMGDPDCLVEVQVTAAK